MWLGFESIGAVHDEVFTNRQLAYRAVTDRDHFSPYLKLSQDTQSRTSEVDCLLLFAPQFLPVAPPAGLGYLIPQLRKRGLTVAARDLNAELYDTLLSRVTTDHLRTKLLSTAASEAYENDPIVHFASTLNGKGAKVESAKQLLKLKSTYRRSDGFGEAIATIEAHLDIINALHTPAYIGLTVGRLAGDASLSSIVAQLEDEDDISVRLLKLFVRRYLHRYRPRVLAISNAANAEYAVLVAAIAKHLDPSVFVVVGGPGVSLTRNVFAEHPEYFDVIDAVVVFDGEPALPRLVEDVTADRLNLAQVPNVIYRDSGSGRTVSTDMELFSLGAARPPAYSDFDLSLYLSPGPLLPIEIGRGCYWNKCEFCDRPIGFTPGPGHIRFKSATQVVREMIWLRDTHDCHHFYITDDAVSAKMLRALSEELSSLNANIFWMALARFEKDLANPEFIALLRRGGCAKLALGLESGVQRVADLMRKGIRVDVVPKIIKACDSAGLPLHIWALTGFPGETYEEANTTMGFIREMLPYLDRPGFSFQFSPFALDYLSPVNMRPEDFGITTRVRSPRRFATFHDSVTAASHMAWPVAPKELASSFIDELKRYVADPALITHEYIVGFILGIFRSTQHGRQADANSGVGANEKRPLASRH